MTDKPEISLETVGQGNALELFTLELHQVLAELTDPQTKNRRLVWYRRPPEIICSQAAAPYPEVNPGESCSTC